MKFPTSIRIILGSIIILVLGGLAGWYFYLHSQITLGNTGLNTDTTGLGPAPSFDRSGSTPSNQINGGGHLGTSNTSRTSTSSALWQVDPTAVAGMGFVTTQTSEYLYYVERGNGYIFAAHPSDYSSSRLTNTLMPKIYQALFALDGSVVERSIDTNGNVTTFLGMIATSTAAASSSIPVNNSGPATLTGLYLQPGIRSIAINRTNKALFYLTNDPKGGVIGTSVAWNGTKQKQIFSSSISSWRPSILDDGTVMLLESPADGIPGYAYTISSAGTLTPLVRNVAGLTVLPKTSSSLLLYGSSNGGSLSLYGVASSSPRALTINTIADKCVWLPGSSEIAYCAVPNTATQNNFLTSWYQGSTHTSDDWWQIDLSTGTAVRIYSPSSNNVSLDVENPIIDPSGNYIAFINATNQSLWVLRVAQ